MPSNIRFGIFDWLDGDSSHAADLYDQRLRIVECADTAGFDLSGPTCPSWNTEDCCRFRPA
jgi:hypothetical protein